MNIVTRISCIFQIRLFGKMRFIDKYKNQYEIHKNQRWMRTVNKGVHSDDNGQLMVIRSMIRNLIAKKPNINMIDIGACVGVVSFSASSVLRDCDRVFCIEPEKSNFDCLLKNMKLNSSLKPQIFPFNIAISDFDGKAYLSINANNYGGHKITSSDLNEDKNLQEVECQSLSSFCESQNIEVLDILKIDAEGHDAKIILSSANLFRQNRVILLFVECEERDQEFLKLESFLRDCDYLLFYVARDSMLVHSTYNRWNQYASRKPLNMLAILSSQRWLLTNSEVIIRD